MNAKSFRTLLSPGFRPSVLPSLLLCVAGSMIGCSGKSLVGNWKYKDVTLSPDAEKQIAAAHISDNVVKQTVSTSTLVVKDAKSFEMTMPQQAIVGTYSVDKDSVNFNATTINGKTPGEMKESAKTLLKNQPEMLKKIESANIGLMKGTLLDDGKELDLVDSAGDTIKFSKGS